VVRPVRPDGHGAGWAELEARQQQIAGWVAGGVPVVKIGVLLARQGVVVAERTLNRFVAERCGGKKVTTPVDDGPPGSELQIDFGAPQCPPLAGQFRRVRRALCPRPGRCWVPATGLGASRPRYRWTILWLRSIRLLGGGRVSRR
jgi:hypothetical protein